MNSMSDLKGIDISHHQNDKGAIDWSAVKSAGYSFAFIKLTEGQTFKDPYGTQNVKDAKDHGFLVGGYHFARFLNVDEAKKEADFFRSVADRLDYVILDIEHKEASGDLTEASLVFLDKVADLGIAVFYSYPSFIKAHFNKSATKYPLWISNFLADKPEVPFWSDWSVWQHDSKASVPGVTGDCDVNFMKAEFAIHKEVHQTQTKAEVVVNSKYAIKSGDTFWDLEQKNHWKNGILSELNPKVDPKILKIGQVIIVPDEVKHSEVVFHTVQKDENLSLIASKSGLSLSEIENLNPHIKQPNLIHPGDKIRVK